MAFGLTIAAVIFAVPVSLAAWMLGLLSFGQAVLAYVALGWCTILGGLLAKWLSTMITSRSREGRSAHSRSTVVQVTLVNRN